MADTALSIDCDLNRETPIGNSELLNLFSRTSDIDRTGAGIFEAHDLLSRIHLEKNYPLWKYVIEDIPLSASRPK